MRYKSLIIVLKINKMLADIIVIGCNGYVAAVNAGSGKEIWFTKLKDGVISGSRGKDVSVLLDGNRIYAGCYGYLYCLDTETGKILWENELRGIGFNEVALAKQGTSVQFVTRVEHHNNS